MEEDFRERRIAALKHQAELRNNPKYMAKRRADAWRILIFATLVSAITIAAAVLLR